jgi:uncharacterized protein YcfL
MTSVTFTTKDGETNVGNPFILGFTSDKTDESLLFSETYDLELPPPPPPPLANGLPDTSNYTTQLFVTVTGVNAYEYYIPEIITTEQSIQFAVRKSEGGNVTFTYDNSQIGQIFSKLEIVGGSSVSIDLLTNTSVSGVTIDGTTNTVTLPSLGDGSYYTMNVQKVVEGPSEMTINVVEGWNMIGTSDATTVSEIDNDINNKVILSNQIYWYNGSNYEGNTAFEMESHKGYWIKCTKVGQIKLVKVNSTVFNETEYVLSVVEGWNMIGTSRPSIVSEIDNDINNKVILSNEIYWYNGSNYEGNTAFEMESHKGYWIKCTKVGQIKLTF